MRILSINHRLSIVGSAFSLLLLLLLLCGLISGCASTSPTPASQPASTNGQAVETTSPMQTLLVTVALAPESTLNDLQATLANDYQLTQANDWPLESLAIYCFIYKIPVAANADQVIAELEADARVDSAQLIRQFEVLTDSPLSTQQANNPHFNGRNYNRRRYNDPHYPLQYGLKSLKADQMHQWSTGKAVKVGIIDTGIDDSHQDLAAVSYTRSFVGPPSNDFYPENHGTAMAGIIAASANNRVGIVGIAPEAEIIGLRGCWQDKNHQKGRCNSLSLARAIDYANLNHINILNLSLQGPYDPIVARLLAYAVKNHTAVVTAYQPSVHIFPASQPGVIAVTATPSLVESGGMRYQPLASTPIAAPGADIMTTIPSGGFDLLQGSSLAAAHVTGVIALLRELQPATPPAAIASILADSMNKETTAKPASGMINACLALVAIAHQQQKAELQHRTKQGEKELSITNADCLH